MKPEFRCDCSKCLSIRTPINNFYATNKPNRFNWNQLTTDKIYAHIMINYMERGYYRGILIYNMMTGPNFILMMIFRDYLMKVC